MSQLTDLLPATRLSHCRRRQTAEVYIFCSLALAASASPWLLWAQSLPVDGNVSSVCLCKTHHHNARVFWGVGGESEDTRTVWALEKLTEGITVILPWKARTLNFGLTKTCLNILKNVWKGLIDRYRYGRMDGCMDGWLDGRWSIGFIHV